jgi:hypothetical protein
MGAPRNLNAATHRAYSAQIVPLARAQRRRLARQIGLKLSDVDGLGRALLNNWSRAAAALSVMDEYAAREGWLKPDGEPRGFARLYVSMLNSERLALAKLEDYLRRRKHDAADELHAYLEANYRRAE